METPDPQTQDTPGPQGPSPEDRTRLSRQRSNVLWTFLGMVALEGTLGATLGEEGRAPAASLLIFTFIELALILAWVHFDSLERGFRRSAMLNIGIVAMALVFVPMYLYQSRKPEDRIKAFTGLAVFVTLATGVQVAAGWITKLLI